MSEVMEIQEDYNTPETSNRFNKGARHEDEDDHGNEQAYEDVEEQEYDDEEHEDHRNQEEEDDGEEHGEEEEEEDQHHDEDHNDQRELAKRQSSKRLVQNGLTQVQETVDENHHEEEEGEKDEDLINELKTLAGGDNANKPQNKKKPSQGDKSPWDRKNWNQQFSFDQFSGAGSVLSPKVAPEDSHKHYQKFCVEFLDKREEGLQKKRQQKLEDELAVLQDKPKLIAKPLSKPHIPLLDRTPLMDARREKELQKVKEEQEEKKKRELEELTFAPKINPKSKKMTSPTKEHIMNMYLRTKSNYTATATASPPVTVNKKKSDRSFSPRINNNSRNIAETIRENSSDNVVDRLYHRANLGQGKREQLARDLTPTFSPRLNKNTRRIARQIEENYQNRSGSLNRNDDEGNLSDRRRLVTEGDAQNLDEEGDVELLNILKQFNTMLRQKNEAPISIEQLSSLMASYSSKNRGNSTSRPQNIQEQEDEEYETSQRQLQTDRPMRSNIDERRPDIEVNSSPYKKNIQTPRTQSKNFSSPKNPKAQPQAQSPTRSQSPGKKSEALLATLMQNPRHKNKTDDAPTTSINSNIVQRVLGGSPSRKGNTQKSSLSVSQGGKNATKNGSSQKKNTKGGKTASAKNGVVRNSDGQGVEKGAQASQKSPNFAEDNGSQEAGSKNALEGWYSSNQERKETEDEYVYRTQEEEERPKGHVANRLTTEDYEEEDRYGGSKREELFEDEQAEENNEAGEEQYYEEEEAEAQNREEEVQNNEGDGEEEHQEQQNYEDVANQDYQSQQANGENEENRDHEGQEVKDEERNEEQHTDREVQNQDDNSQKKAEEKLKRQSVYSSQGFYERNEQPQKKGKGRLSVQSSQGYYGRNDKQPGYPANVQGKDSRNYKSQNKIKGNESKQSVQEENKASQKSFDLTAGSQKSLIIHNDVSLEQGQLSKQNIKSSNSVQRENPRTKQHRDSAFKKKKESIDQAEEEQRYQNEQMTQSIQDSQQARPEDNVSFSENTIENHISFDEHQAPQTDHRLLEDLMSLGSKTFSVKPETPKKVSPKKPQIQFEVITTETIQIEPPSVKKTNFSFSMDGTEIPVTSASGSELKQMAQHTVKKFKAYDAQIKQMASREYKVSVSPPKSNSKSPDEKKEMKPTSPRILTPKGPKVFKSIEKGGASKTPRSNITRSSVLKNSVQGSLSSVHSGKEGFLSKRGDLDRSGMSTKRK